MKPTDKSGGPSARLPVCPLFNKKAKRIKYKTIKQLIISDLRSGKGSGLRFI